MIKQFFKLFYVMLFVSLITACGGGGGGGGGSTTYQEPGDVDRIVIFPEAGELNDIYTIKQDNEASILEIPFSFKLDDENGQEVMPELSIYSQDAKGAEISFKKPEDLAESEKNKLIIKWDSAGSNLDITESKEIIFTIRYTYDGKTLVSNRYTQNVIYEGNKLSGFPESSFELRNTISGDTQQFDLDFSLPDNSEYIKEVVLDNTKVQNGVVASIKKDGNDFKLEFFLRDEYEGPEKDKPFEFDYAVKSIVKDKNGKVLSERLYDNLKADITLVREDVDDVDVIFVNAPVDKTTTVLMGTKDIILPYSFTYGKQQQGKTPVTVNPTVYVEADSDAKLSMAFEPEKTKGENDLKITWSDSDTSLDNLVTKTVKYRVQYTYNNHTKRTKVLTHTINFVPITVSAVPSETSLDNSIDKNYKDSPLSIISPDNIKYSKFNYKDIEVIQKDNKDKVKIVYHKGSKDGEGTLRFALADGFAISKAENLVVNYDIKVTAGESSSNKLTRTIPKEIKINLKTLAVDKVVVTPLEPVNSINVLAALNNNTAEIGYKVELNGAVVTNDLKNKGIHLSAELVKEGTDQDMGVNVEDYSNKVAVSWNGSTLNLDNPESKKVKYRIKYSYEGSTKITEVYSLVVNFTPIKIAGGKDTLELRNAVDRNSASMTFSISSPTGAYNPKEISVKSAVCPEDVTCVASANSIKYALKNKITGNKAIVAEYEVDVTVGKAVRKFKEKVNIELKHEEVDKIAINRTSENILKVIMPKQKAVANYKFTINNVDKNVSPIAVFESAEIIENGASAATISQNDMILAFSGNNLDFTWKGADNLKDKAYEIKVQYRIKYALNNLTNISDLQTQTIVFEPILIKGDTKKLALDNTPGLKQRLELAVDTPSYGYNSVTASCDSGQNLGIVVCSVENGGRDLVFSLKDKITDGAKPVTVNYTVVAKVGKSASDFSTRTFNRAVNINLVLGDADDFNVKPKSSSTSYDLVRNYGGYNQVEIPYEVYKGEILLTDLSNIALDVVKEAADGADIAFKPNSSNLIIKWKDDNIADLDKEVNKTVKYKVTYKYGDNLRETAVYTISVKALPILLSKPTQELTFKNDIRERSKDVSLNISPANAKISQVKFTNSDIRINSKFDDKDKITYSLAKDIISTAIAPVTINYEVTAAVGDSVRVFKESVVLKFNLTSADSVKYTQNTLDDVYIAMPLKEGAADFTFSTDSGSIENVSYEPVLLKAQVKGTGEAVNDLSLSVAKGAAGALAVKALWNGSNDKLDVSKTIEVTYAIKYTFGSNTNITKNFTNTFVYEPIKLEGFINSANLRNADGNKEHSKELKITTSTKVKGDRSVTINVTNPHLNVIKTTVDKGILTVSIAKPITEDSAKGDYNITYNVTAKIGNAERTFKNNNLVVKLFYEDVDKITVSEPSKDAIKVVMSENPVTPFSFKDGAIEIDVANLTLSAKIDSVKNGMLSDYQAIFNGKNLVIKWSGSKINANNAHSDEVTYSVTYGYKGYALTKSYIQKVAYEPILISGNLENITMGNTDDAKNQTANLTISSPTTFQPVTLAMDKVSSQKKFFDVTLDPAVKVLTYSIVKEIGPSDSSDAASYLIKASVKGKYAETITREFPLNTNAVFVRKPVDDVTVQKATVGVINVIMPDQTARVNFNVMKNGIESMDGVKLEVVPVDKADDINFNFSTVNKNVLEITWTGANGDITDRRVKNVKYKIRYTYEGFTKTTSEFAQKIVYEPIVITSQYTDLNFKNAENSRKKEVKFLLDNPKNYDYSVIDVKVKPTDAKAANIITSYNANNGVLTLELENDIAKDLDISLPYVVSVKVGKDASHFTSKEIKNLTLPIQHRLEEVEKLTIEYPEKADYTLILPNDKLSLSYKFLEVGNDVSSVVGFKLAAISKDADVDLTFNPVTKSVQINWTGANTSVSSKTTKVVKFKLEYTYKNVTIKSKELVYTVVYQPLDVKGFYNDGKFKNTLLTSPLNATLTLAAPTVSGAKVSYELSNVSSTENLFDLSLNNSVLSLKLKKKLHIDDDGDTYDLRYTITAVLKKDGAEIGRRVIERNTKLTFEKMEGDNHDVEDLDPTPEDNNKDQDAPGGGGAGVYTVVLGTSGSNKAEVVYSFKDKSGSIVNVRDFALEGTPTTNNANVVVTCEPSGNKITFKWNGDAPSADTSVSVNYKYSFKYGKSDFKRIENVNATVNFIPITALITPSEVTEISFGVPQYIAVNIKPSVTGSGNAGDFSISNITATDGFKAELEGKNKIKVSANKRFDINYNKDIEVNYTVSAQIDKHNYVAQDAKLVANKVSKFKYKYVPPFEIELETQNMVAGKVLVADKAYFTVKAVGSSEAVNLLDVTEVAADPSVSGNSCTGLLIKKENGKIVVHAPKNIQASNGCKLGLRVSAQGSSEIASKDFTYTFIVKPSFDFGLVEGTDTNLNIMKDALLTFAPKDITLGVNSVESCEGVTITPINGTEAGSKKNVLKVAMNDPNSFQDCEATIKLKADRDGYITSYKDVKINIANLNITAAWNNKTITISALNNSGYDVIGLPLHNKSGADFDISVTPASDFVLTKNGKEMLSLGYKKAVKDLSYIDIKDVTIKLTTKDTEKVTYTFKAKLQAESGKSASCPISIYNPEMLRAIAHHNDDLARYYKLEQGANFYKMAKLDVGGDFWEPIGNTNKPFTGGFDGNNNAIHNLTIDGSKNNQGLFGVIELFVTNKDNGVAPVKNVKLVDVKGTCSTGTCNGENIGALVGFLNDTYFNGSSNCNSYNACSYQNKFQLSINNSIVNISESIKGGNNVGGAVGKMHRGILKSVLVRGDVYGTGDNVGGVIGYGEFTQFYTNNATELKDMIRSRDQEVLYKDGRVEGRNNVGGYIGKITTNIWDKNYDYSTSGSGYLVVFGLSTKNIEVIANGNAAGGLIGALEGTALLSSNYNANGKIISQNSKHLIRMENSWSSGSIVHAKGDYTGGLIGSFAPQLITEIMGHAYSAGLTHSYVNNLVVSGSRYTGGIIGGMPSEEDNMKNANGNDVKADGALRLVNSKSVIVNSYDFNNGEQPIGAGSEADYIGFIAGKINGVAPRAGAVGAGCDVHINLITVSNTIVSKDKIGGLYPTTRTSYNSNTNTIFIKSDSNQLERNDGKIVMLKSLSDYEAKKLYLSYHHIGYTQIGDSTFDQGFTAKNMFYLLKEDSFENIDYAENELVALCGNRVCTSDKVKVDNRKPPIYADEEFVPLNSLYTSFFQSKGSLRNTLCDAYKIGSGSVGIYIGEIGSLESTNCRNGNKGNTLRIFDNSNSESSIPYSIQDQEVFGVQLLNQQ